MVDLTEMVEEVTVLHLEDKEMEDSLVVEVLEHFLVDVVAGKVREG